MSGHSKWAQIHRQKGVADIKRGAVFTKLGKAVTIAAKLGGGDPESNFRLRLAIDQAKAANMPKDNIERAIKRGTGELDDGKKIEAVTYEGFGPEATAFIIEALTDNRNRTSAAIKHILNKYGGGLGGPNSVSWMFEPRGIIKINKIDETLELELIDRGVEDIVKESDGITLQTQTDNLKKIKDYLENKNITIEYAENELVAKDQKTLNPEQQEKIQKLFEELEDNEDVNNYYTNAQI
ncbi:MAG: YebC/PmpR family DNA-binding transcriptional regulator [Patescibacteria group bacterium]|jgi:YebC/PmpR family DNA-binding regulatory protein|nr:YebC/PmpR family DNA-binding transcriptional regulator [Patescibacteria group bacterium]